MSAPDIPSEYTIHNNMSGGMVVETTMVGDPNRPLATLMTGDPNKPLATLMVGDANKPLATLMTGDRQKPLTTLLIGDPKQPIAMSMQMEMLNLPRFTLNDIKDMMKMRIRMPNYSQFCFKLFGQELFSFCMSGEQQVITGPYVPNSHERCEEPCCEPDTRPFPEQPGNNPNSDTNPDR